MTDPRERAFVQDLTPCVSCSHERRAHIFGSGGCTHFTTARVTCHCATFVAAPTLRGAAA